MGELGIQLLIGEETCKWKVSEKVPREEKWNFTQIGLIPIAPVDAKHLGWIIFHERSEEKANKQEEENYWFLDCVGRLSSSRRILFVIQSMHCPPPPLPGPGRHWL